GDHLEIFSWAHPVGDVPMTIPRLARAPDGRYRTPMRILRLAMFTLLWLIVPPPTSLVLVFLLCACRQGTLEGWREAQRGLRAAHGDETVLDRLEAGGDAAVFARELDAALKQFGIVGGEELGHLRGRALVDEPDHLLRARPRQIGRSHLRRRGP